MKERPILFQGAMIRALLAGTKTQTRRIVKPELGLHVYLQSGYGARYQSTWQDGRCVETVTPGRPHTELVTPHCPYGQPGDRLWVREAWGYFDPDGSGEDYDRDRNSEGGSGPCKSFRPEMLQEGHALRNYWRRRVTFAATWKEGQYGSGVEGPKRWRPSIHMPRWASRILLEVTDVRVQRLWDISEADARAEGWDGTVLGYAKLWESINGAGSWDANPWVWAVSFKREQP